MPTPGTMADARGKGDVRSRFGYTVLVLTGGSSSIIYRYHESERCHRLPINRMVCNREPGVTVCSMVFARQSPPVFSTIGANVGAGNGNAYIAFDSRPLHHRCLLDNWRNVALRMTLQTPTCSECKNHQLVRYTDAPPHPLSYTLPPKVALFYHSRGSPVPTLFKRCPSVG